MTISRLAIWAGAAAVALLGNIGIAAAQNVTISVWSGGTGPNDNYRVDAIEMAADILERERAIAGEDLNITVEKKAYPGWDDFKQALTLAAEAGNAPNIVVTGHEDIAPWSQSGLIVPAEDYLNLDAWPINDIYENLMEIASYGGVVYGLPQDAESRPFFFWKPHMKAIGYSDEDLEALPARVQAGEYTLANVLEDAKKMQDAGVVQAGYGFYPRPENGPDYWQFYTSFGGVMEEDGKLVLDKAAMQRFYQFFADAVAAGVTRKNHIGTPNDQWYSEVPSGKVGIWHGGTWHYARYVNQEGLKDFFGNIAFTLIPAGEGGKANTLTHPLVYLLTSKHGEDETTIAAELIKIASEPRINTLHAIKSAHLGIAHQQSNIDLYSSDRWAREATERLLPHANAMPNNTNFGVYWSAMWKGLESAWTGQKTPEQAVNDVEAELRNSLGEAIVIR
ncbi:extracellular solute-binding protein [Aquamicrobium defluvii]|uniref:ABC transporter substrate-binding protein n=1 Tax=Aquamicrobium defluvii TaxID=69279 RepID=A0A011SVC1_9HYPH|nr:ABC transporter substrate-binding protein [Aquamicrobium defluvii]EZQ13501.1 ABC transporter substrate-binding protein [Halopseudomonas bauzanensis]TDR33650.1 carbohydrate ABC transporter substrate-binding protein (CUT1 family) [Aquamicrobium defluvii]